MRASGPGFCLHGALACLVGVLACTAEIGRGERSAPAEECRGLGPLTLEVTPPRVRVGGAAVLKASGGSGHYAFAVQPKGPASSGPGAGLSAAMRVLLEGEIRGDRFVAGQTPGAVELRVEDALCMSGRATATLDVVGGFKVSPLRATVKPRVAFTIVTEGVIGAPVFALARTESGATLTPEGHYVAGARGDGLDLVHVRDGATGEEVLVQIRVSAAARFRAEPERLAVPAGASVPLETRDGTDKVDWKKTTGPGVVVPSDGRAALFVAEANGSGVAELEGRDRFTGDVARVKVRVLDELKRPTVAFGRGTDFGTLVTGDFDGDRLLDLAVGIPESDLGKPQGGVVLIWKGTPEGPTGAFGAAPTWTILGRTDTAQLGAAMAVGDLDGDGRDDLAVAEPGADVTVGDSGGVEIYRIRGDKPEPLRATLTGVGRGSFGASLAVADVDGDGMKDIVVGAPGADLAPTPTLSRRGVVDVFLVKKAAPIPDLGSLRIGGWDLTPEGAIQARSNVGLGRALLVDDLDGDGKVDLAAMSTLPGRPIGAGMAARPQPAVQIHFSRGGPRPFDELPDVFVLPAEPLDANEGTYRLAVIPKHGARGPLLLVAADLTDAPAAVDAGVVQLFDVAGKKSAGPPSRTPPLITRDAALLRLAGDAPGGALGRAFALADVDDDRQPELLLGAPLAPPPGGAPGTLRAGRILAFGLGGLTPGAALTPVSQRFGAPGDALGAGLAAWTHTKGFAVVALASRASTKAGRFTGRLDAFDAEKTPMDTWKAVSVDVPAVPANEGFGATVTVSTRGGRPLAGVGAALTPGVRASMDGTEPGLGQGAAWDLATPDAPKTSVLGALTPLQRGGRGVGADVAFTDFNGDGRPDLVIGAPNLQIPSVAQRPTEITPHYVREPDGCLTAAAQSTGGVLVHLGRPDGSFAPAYRLTAPLQIADCTPATDPRCRRGAIGRGLVGDFDWDGDGKQDVAALRTGGVEVFLGRAPDDESLAKLTLLCASAYTLPAQTPAVTSALAALGDLDGDGCDDLGLRVSPDGNRGGVLILFGQDPTGARCRRASVPGGVGVRILADPEVGLPGVGLGLAITRAGKLTAEGDDWLAVSAARYPVDGVPQPAVLLYEVAALTSAAFAFTAPASGGDGDAGTGANGNNDAGARGTNGGRDANAASDGGASGTSGGSDAGAGDGGVLVNLGLGPRVVMLPAWGDPLGPRVLVLDGRSGTLGTFGTSLAGNVDVTGDGRPDLVVGSPLATLAGEAAGAVYVFAGGFAAPAEKATVLVPWAIAVGDGRERGMFGADVALAPAAGSVGPFLVVGAPTSYRTGTQNGTAFVLPVRF